MTQLQAVSLVEADNDKQCVICGNPDIPYYSLYCATRRCRHEYERKVGKLRSTKAYKDFMFWHTYDLMHITFEDHRPLASIDQVIR